MRTLKTFEKFNESVGEINLPNEISISDFIDELNKKSPLPVSKQVILDWWEKNLSMIKIFYFPFKNNQIMGCFFSGNKIAVNSTSFSPSDMKLFITLHESKHVLQDLDGTVEEKYFNTVVNENKEEFLINYKMLEEDANDFAINGCKEIGLNNIVLNEQRLRMNENIGEIIYNMMLTDIKKTGSTTFSELLSNQVL
tara:strand:+ start:405 stop:992 length:588 start_codon:yes stop_codon:yes gene_type:complete